MLTGLRIDPRCHYTKSIELVETKCLGKTECFVKNDVKELEIRDPCPDVMWEKRLLASARCG
jgi:hypothetical protein